VDSPIHLLGPFKIPWLRGERRVRVYVPPNNPAVLRACDPAGAAPPVLYMFDGQNIFDDEPSFAGGWWLHHTARDLAARGLPAPVIVGIDHGGHTRTRELSPYRMKARGQLPHLIRWLARDLAPKIQREFGVRRDPGGVAVGGSSMGGLAALYAHFHRPDVFGAALCMSPSLWVGRGKIFEFIDKQPKPWTTRIWLDAGHHEPGMLRQAERMFHQLRRRGYGDHDLRWHADPIGRHSELSWRGRAPHALEFLFAGTHAHQRAA
jgi:enterochelin esterase-like enzyme